MRYVCTLAILAASPLFAQQDPHVNATVREAVCEEVQRAVVGAVLTSMAIGAVTTSAAVSAEISGTVSEAVRAEVARRVKAAVDRRLAKRRARVAGDNTQPYDAGPK